MTRRPLAHGLLAASSLVLAAAGVWAADEGQSTSVYPVSTYQPIPGPAPTGNVIGYTPIPINALASQAIGPVPAQPDALRASPMPSSQAAPRAANAAQTRAPNAVLPLQTTMPGQSQGQAPGAGTATDAQGQPLPAGYLTGIVGEGFYTLGRDDVIRIVVRNQPEFSGDFIIGFDGRIQYTYLGDIPIAGLTKYEVQQVLEKLLKRYIRIPDVNVSIMAYNSKVVYVIGEVNAPGKFIMRGDAIKLREAILAAALPTKTAALSRVHVIKPDLDTPKVRVINVKRILYGGKLKDDVELVSGEIVVVPSTVMSKVNDFLTTLLSPITRAASVAALAAF